MHCPGCTRALLLRLPLASTRPATHWGSKQEQACRTRRQGAKTRWGQVALNTTLLLKRPQIVLCYSVKASPLLLLDACEVALAQRPKSCRTARSPQRAPPGLNRCCARSAQTRTLCVVVRARYALNGRARIGRAMMSARGGRGRRGSCSRQGCTSSGWGRAPAAAAIDARSWACPWAGCCRVGVAGDSRSASCCSSRGLGSVLRHLGSASCGPGLAGPAGQAAPVDGSLPVRPPRAADVRACVGEMSGKAEVRRKQRARSKGQGAEECNTSTARVVAWQDDDVWHMRGGLLPSRGRGSGRGPHLEHGIRPRCRGRGVAEEWQRQPRQRLQLALLARPRGARGNARAIACGLRAHAPALLTAVWLPPLLAAQQGRAAAAALCTVLRAGWRDRGRCAGDVDGGPKVGWLPVERELAGRVWLRRRHHLVAAEPLGR